jgi:hypothetical protein
VPFALAVDVAAPINAETHYFLTQSTAGKFKFLHCGINSAARFHEALFDQTAFICFKALRERRLFVALICLSGFTENKLGVGRKCLQVNAIAHLVRVADRMSDFQKMLLLPPTGSDGVNPDRALAVCHTLQ